MIHRASASHERYVRGVHSTQLLSKDQKTAGTPHADAVRTGWRVAAARAHGLASSALAVSLVMSGREHAAAHAPHVRGQPTHATSDVRAGSPIALSSQGLPLATCRSVCVVALELRLTSSRRAASCWLRLDAHGHSDGGCACLPIHSATCMHRPHMHMRPHALSACRQSVGL